MLMEIQLNIQDFKVVFIGAPGKNYSSSIGLSIQNTLEAKVKPKDSTQTELRKVNIFKNLNISTSYNLAAEEFQLSPIRVCWKC